MYLSKLEIVGFKSFAQKVNLAFDSGISAIVGPNGCGKTNIVDAIRWVLGEQRYSALRSDKMEDVIFNGTKTRKPLGMAEASLVIENTKGILPSEYSQVTVGRRVYRSGESEYLLNKTPCRLKDILDLFMDTGMGSDAYSVIELKMIEIILSDRTDERRRLFEEAAGVTKYKHRRKAAYRKLEDVRADLTRVNDIVTEVQKAVNSLERQARKAEQFNELTTRLRTLEIDLMEREYTQILGRIAPLENKISALQADRSSIDTGLATGEQRLDDLRTALLESEKRLAEAQRDESLQRERTHAVEQKTVVAAERINALEASIRRAEGERGRLAGETVRLEEAKISLTARIAELETHGRGVEADHAQKQEELQAFEAVLDEGKKSLHVLNEKTIALVHQIAELQTEQEKKRGRADYLEGRRAHAAEEIASYEAEIVRLDARSAELTAEDRRLRRQFTDAEVAYYDAEKRRTEIAAQMERLQGRMLDMRSEIERRTARIDFLNGLIHSREGLSSGVQFLATSPAWGESRATTVADAVHAEERYRPALEAALGEFAGCVVVDNAEAAHTAISVLKSEDKGKVSFVCLDRLPMIVSRLTTPRAQGIVGWATDLASFEPKYDALYRFLLDRVLVVDSSETARRIASLYPGIRCVTLEGEVESGAGLTRGGSRRQDEGGLIGKRQQIDELNAEVERLQGDVAGLEAEREAAQKEHDAIDLKEMGNAVKVVEKEMNGVEMRIAQVQFEKKRAQEISGRNREESEELQGEAADLRKQLDDEAPALEALRTEKSDTERNAGAAASKLEELEEEWNQRSEEVRALGIAVVEARNDLANAGSELERTGTLIEETGASIGRYQTEAAQAAETIAATEASVAEHSMELERLKAELVSLQTHRGAIEEETSTCREEMHAIELAIKDQRRTHDESLRMLHEHELQLHDLKTRIDHLSSRASEEFGLILEMKSYPEDEFVNFAALREEVPTLRDKIKSLGNINFAAFEEFTQEKERFETLNVQRNDLLGAEKNLLTTIEEINTTAQNQFIDTFTKIRSNFIETFKSLFDPGDECDLKLEENVDPLEAKVEIVAKPRGKRPTSIDLLSGGEKTLTAIALLFAIYLVKPSPFCILDEVDAPLDDANVDRFTRILRKFSDNTQFIVVTHNKRTMEAANAMYGITMEEEGVSKIVTVRFNQGGSVASTKMAAG